MSLKYRRSHFNKFSCITFFSGEAAWLRSVLRDKLRSTNLIKINTHGIASYYFRRSLRGIIMQTDSFQKFSDLTLKATFMIFRIKDLGFFQDLGFRIATYYFRRSLRGIIMQTDSFQKFSDLTLKATFIIFFGKELKTNLIECQH